MRDRIENDYFEWLFKLACGERYSPTISFRKLLNYLHSVEFTFLIPKDVNRAKDGVDLRYHFSLACDDASIVDQITGPCSVLEMMLALAIRCEDTMDDPGIGDRTKQWFWGMLSSLGLNHMSDDIFDQELTESIIKRFLNREYEPNGRGGLFTIKNCDCDLREVEIWSQLWWYLDNFV